MSKHTPGPWGVPDQGRGVVSKGSTTGGWEGLIATADCGDYARSRDEGLANARLIAAAPELLEACQRLLAHLEEVESMHKGSDDDEIFARMVIAKATASEQKGEK